VAIVDATIATLAFHASRLHSRSISTNMRGDPPMGALPVLSGAPRRSCRENSD
jgi:hypothetical protein